VRGLGGGRATRRVLAGGGRGPARALNTALAGWEGVRITPMFGRWSYFAGDQLFACFPLRDKDRDLWVRLGSADQARALRRGWIELTIEAEPDLAGALRWLRRAHAAAVRGDESATEAP
jgi:hypothetical protein